MQALATELGISETAYLTPTDDPLAFGLRWFSPATEINLCGHATLASAHALRQSGTIDGSAPLTFHTRSGALSASFDGERVELELPGRPHRLRGPARPARGPVAGRGRRVGADHQLRLRRAVLGRGRRRLRARPRRHRGQRARTRSCSPRRRDPARAPTTSCASSAPSSASTRTRPPARPSARPGPTGPSASGRPELVARQLSARGATLYVRPDGDRVRIGGRATTVLTGHLC